ncbi:hypothetical protein EON83_16555 [bacterium]|nr:MAG: hypothetical protein EON83_16555 [bacterium]
MILFPTDALERSEVERDYRIEFEAACAAGFNTALFDFDGLRRGDTIEQILRRVPQSISPQALIYRGWMLSEVDYARLETGLSSLGCKLINDAGAYRFGHHAPENYNLWQRWLPQTTWVEREKFEANGEVDFAPIFDALKQFGAAPIIVKDWVKSQKHRWAQACFIPNASDKSAVRRIVNRFLELQGDYLTGGLVFRQFEKLRHNEAGQTFEWRSFWFDGQLLSLSPNPVGAEKPTLEDVAEVASQYPSRFFTLDWAQRDDGQWMMIEMGDGGVLGLPSGIDVEEWYRNLKQAFDNDAVLASS